jgi:mannose-1-phosphate guanylyltransferase
MALHAVIMAGGSGTRFWPLSRAAHPKQLLKLVGERTMIQSTVDRLGKMVTPDRLLIVTGERLVSAIAEQLPNLPASAILGEPCRRDTAPCIGLAAMRVLRDDPDAVMAVMPSDHVISTDQQFQQAVEFAVRLVEESPQRIVTFGVKPTYPAESFGYIECGERLKTGAAGAKNSPAAYQVRRFREKPKADLAREYVAAGSFYWNAGIFVWRASTILDALQKHEPEMYAHLAKIAAAAAGPNAATVFRSEFEAIQGKSIDYAVMEHAGDIVVVEAPFAWDDVGSWQAIARLQKQDASGNTIVGKHLGVRTSGSIIRSSGDHLAVTLGLKNCIVVHTPDATLVANRDDEEAVRELVQLIQQRGWGQYL